MVTITEVAQQKIIELTAKSESPVKGLRVAANVVSPVKVDFRMAFLGEDYEGSGDEVIEFDGFDVYIDAESSLHVHEATIDYVDGLMGSGFKIDAPPKRPLDLSGPLVEKIQTVIEQQINPAVASHGGYVSLIDVKENVVFLEMGGGCQGCGQANVTLKQGIEVMIKEAVPEVEEIYDVTEHAAGKTPYYQSAE